ncbi:MAG: tetratricopeptide repeat protein [Treponema sp.]|jgi:tetratricopeptide (TPR) repeat protein|nr:tetratricopeptide repeat protein [Treponema sp.]
MKDFALFIPVFLFSFVSLHAGPLPGYIIAFRDALYEQNLKAGEMDGLYRAAKTGASALDDGAAKFTLLSRCEYLMGRAFQYEERKDEAAARYEEGIHWAEKALDAGGGSEAWQMLAENISQSCAVRSTAYAMANGLKVEKYAKSALELNSRNAAALYMIASRWIYAPAPFGNYRRGIQMMQEIITGGDMQRDDEFNVYSAIGYAYVRQKKYAEARPWLLKSLEVYPDNKYARSLLENPDAEKR